MNNVILHDSVDNMRINFAIDIYRDKIPWRKLIREEPPDWRVIILPAADILIFIS